jgi:hypothetical protein
MFRSIPLPMLVCGWRRLAHLSFNESVWIIEGTPIPINRHERIIGDRRYQSRAECASDKQDLESGGGGFLHGDHSIRG